MGFTEKMLIGDIHLPEIEIVNKFDIPAVTDLPEINLELHVSDSKYLLDRVNIWVNDVAIYGTQGISLKDGSIKDHMMNVKVDLARGTNQVQLSVLNQAGAESYKTAFDIKCSAGKSDRDLYILTLGVSKYKDERYDLKYAAKDALDLAATFEKQSFFSKVHTKTLTDADVVKENMHELKNFLLDADINDQVILFVAGHGVLDQHFDYYFGSYDMDFQNPADRGIAYEELEHLLDGIKPLRKLLFMDTCHSGEVDKDDIQLSAENDEEEDGDIVFRNVGAKVENKENQFGLHNSTELMKSLFTDFRKGTGSTVISSSGGVEFAMESDTWQNGLFTYCLISGLIEFKADLNDDKEISVLELQAYIQAEVSTLSNGRQTPTSRIVNNTLNYRVW
jgi:hypothetical protein